MNLKDRKLSWYETTVFRAALLALLIVCGSYYGSYLSVRQAIQGFSTMVYDEELARALTDSLDLLKELDTAKRQTLLLRLQSLRGRNPVIASEAELKALLVQSGIEELTPLESLEIETLTKPGPAAWLGRTELQLGSYLVKVPTSDIRQHFEHLQKVRQRYELIQATWDQQIAPSLLRGHRLILIGTALLLGGGLLVLVRRYIREAQQLLAGLRRWSQAEDSFRFKTPMHGELEVIAHQFNHMAEEVAWNRSRNQYLEKIASWQTMGRKLAHEIKNPLTPIQMMVSRLQTKFEPGDPSFKELLDDACAIINEEVMALRRLVEHFSQFAKLPEPQTELVDLQNLCQQAIDLQATAFPQHSFQFTGIDKSRLEAYVDPLLIKQVVANLLKNAAEASEDRCARIQLRLIEDEAQHCIIEVEDDGPGIPASDRERIWEAYFTSKHTGPNPGMGLGLAICKKIAIDHHGELTMTSQTGKTIFRLVLPKDPQQPTSAFEFPSQGEKP